MHNHKTSLREQPTRELIQLRAQAANHLAATQVMVGRLVAEHRACGKPNCAKCGPGQAKHGPYHYFLARSGGRGRAVYVPSNLADQVARYVAGGQASAEALELITRINTELLRRRELD